MPAEAERLKRGFGRRDRRFLLALCAAGLVFAPAAAVLQHGGGRAPRVGAPCVSVAHAGVLGGGTYHYCGAAAVSFCRRFAADDDVAIACGRLGQAPAGSSSAAASAGRVRRSQSVAFRNAAATISRATMYSQSRITVAAPSAP